MPEPPAGVLAGVSVEPGSNAPGHDLREKEVPRSGQDVDLIIDIGFPGAILARISIRVLGGVSVSYFGPDFA